ncbi:MAG: hypothetical protein AAF270_05490 [Pseudomonadota bacterium]
MASENHTIAKYQYELHNQFTDGRINDNALLYLYGKDKQLLAIVAFVPDAQALASPEQEPEGHIAIEMHIRQLASLIDMLRNEKPVRFSWNAASNVVRISTQQEPVGEQELKKMFRFLYI